MPMSVQMASHDQNGYFAPYFNDLDLSNAMVPFSMPLASSDTDSGNSGI